MALFGRNTKEDAATPQEHADTNAMHKKHIADVDVAGVLRNPRITEKATEQSMRNTYVFDVARDANKKQIAAAVRAVYKIEPRKIRVINVPTKRVRNARTGVWGMKEGGKKAYVYLKDGDSISIL